MLNTFIIIPSSSGIPVVPMDGKIGLIISLSFSLIAFEWQSYDNNASNFGKLDMALDDEEIIPITQREIKPPPPPPPSTRPPKHQLNRVRDRRKQIDEMQQQLRTRLQTPNTGTFCSQDSGTA